MLTNRELDCKKIEFIENMRNIGLNTHDFKVQRSGGNVGYQLNQSGNEFDSISYAIQYFPDYEYFLIWDVKHHRELNNQKKFSSLSVSDPMRYDHTVFKAHYKKVQETRKYEKVCIVGMDHFKNFFENYALFMNLNEFDEEFPKNVKNEVDWFDPTMRKKYSVSVYARKYDFRKEVLEAYNNQCAICRCNISEILEAAHERGYDVAKTSMDDPKHGICLCRNHHKMYDEKLIDIDLKKRTLSVNDNRIQEMRWFKVFQNEYHGKISQRKDKHNT